MFLLNLLCIYIFHRFHFPTKYGLIHFIKNLHVQKMNNLDLSVLSMASGSTVLTPAEGAGVLSFFCIILMAPYYMKTQHCPHNDNNFSCIHWSAGKMRSDTGLYKES